ncbi:tyrosine-protein phosphatase [Alienimonas sp. DA493]|uniref:phosphatase domain-containing protein n=1 Tax=Alienimonas sp. DA493 TaxID=3373605 RepID=UPI0037551249
MRTPTDPLRRVFYPLTFGALAAACGGHATRGGLWWALLWPAAAFAGAALIYVVGRPGWFGKRADGSRNLLAAALFAPYSWAALAAWHGHRRLGGGAREEGARCDRLQENLHLGGRPLRNGLPAAVRADDRAVILDLTAEFRDVPAVRRRPGYRCAPILDAAAPDAADLRGVVSLLPPPGGAPALIHCANGRGRTGLVAAAWLLAHGEADSPDDAVRQVQAARPRVRLLPRQEAVLEAFAKAPVRQSVSSRFTAPAPPDPPGERPTK